MSGVAVAGTLTRQIGTWDRGRPGPTLLVVGGVHGNEPAGMHAAARVLGALQERELPIAGRVIALRGNLQALASGRRYLERDLNRGWGRSAVAHLLAKADGDLRPEDAEQRELLQCFEAAERTASGPMLFVDLHTSSAAGSPFVLFADTIDNRRVALATGVPLILGIEETIGGASLEWFADRGICGFAVEGGQHHSDAAIDNLEAVLWQLLVHLGMLRPQDVDLAPHREVLRSAVGDAPPIVEIVHRQVIGPEDRFRMEPGFLNFARVDKGQLLATDARGDLRAPYGCHVMLPLYQAQGDDGFFLARRVAGFWLWLAKCMRRLRCGGLLPLLPGIRRDPDDRDTMLADPRIARWFVVEIFHLLGFRKEQRRGTKLAFSRRRSRPENRRL